MERDSQGRGAVVDLELDAKVRRISYRLAYEYDELLRHHHGSCDGCGPGR